MDNIPFFQGWRIALGTLLLLAFGLAWYFGPEMLVAAGYPNLGLAVLLSPVILLVLAMIGTFL